ncbi:hypothetical protein [Celeribacter neptunius]|uniref:Uncharacterized protein n=1 Tax=Celeribacter neptunius TaxID=588602 RepID=A0A1I3JV86_9RHOB|nr:hypothetical protein [Celeribacter neptunius]SFI64000.1 hypothetical protein SAMN04487991_0473 [Celeribacter neptunius]
MRLFEKATAVAFSLAVLSSGSGVMSAQAAEGSDALRSYFDTVIAPELSDPLLLGAIRQQNEKTSGLSEDKIISLDKAWRAQVDTDDHPMVDEVLSGKLPRKLNSVVAAAGGVITEVFVMDALGLNVAASMATSDYWQGDEGKFQNTFGVGVGAVEIGEPEFDISTGVSQAQISATITDPATGKPIGAITVGVIADLLM